MKQNFAAVIVLVASSAAVRAADDHKEFLSWYDGWGTHTVWGIGSLSSGQLAAAVRCGDKLVPIRAVFDTHDFDGEPTATQSDEHCSAANRELLNEFRSAGVECDFHLPSQS